MAWDLAISEHGDLIFAANRDLAGISGVDLIEQRMRLRLRLMRGSWLFDETQTLGSNLHRLIGRSPEEAHTMVTPLVREALRPMSDEITIDEVYHSHVGADGEPAEFHEEARGVVVVVKYHLNDTNGDPSFTNEQRELSIPIVAGGV